MSSGHLAFAVPGDLSTLTGGYIYDRRVMAELRSTGWTVTHLALPNAFPAPSKGDMAETLSMILALPHLVPVVIDGLAFGAFDPAITGQIPNPIIALVHHPLALENGLSDGDKARLFESERDNLRFAAHVIVPSPHTAQTLTETYDVPVEKITIAQPGIDQPVAGRTPVSPPLILSVGIQLPRKGHDVLLKALAQVSDLEWHAVVAGKEIDQAYAAELQSLRAELGLTNRVDIAGQVAKDALGALYRKASIFSLATRYEGYGIVFDEALVHGLPIVSCRAGAVPDTVPEDAGLLVPVDNVDAFAGALRRMLSDDDFRETAARASLAVGRTRPSWKDTAAAFGSALNDLAEPI